MTNLETGYAGRVRCSALQFRCFSCLDGSRHYQKGAVGGVRVDVQLNGGWRWKALEKYQ
jgi:hypothetical protein